MAVSVNDLCTLDFASRPFKQQLLIVSEGRPLKAFSETSTLQNIRTPITPTLFEQVQWLTYCEERKHFFCWPCLLFNPQTSMVRGKTGSNLKDDVVIMNKHEVTEDHLVCSLKLQMFISKNFPPRATSLDKVGHNCVVKKNREMIKCVIDAVCCMVGLRQLNSDGKYSCNLISIEDCKNFLQLLKNYHPSQADAVDSAVGLLNTNSLVVNHVVDAMTTSVKMSIKNEIKGSSYVSIIISGHGCSKTKSQLSTVLRYISRGKVCERFLGFTNCIDIKSKQQLIQCILRPIEEYGIADRFLALSLDGEISYGQSLSLLIESISDKYRFSYFVPWYAHGFGYVLLQTLSVYRECEFFLKMISGIQDFFKNERYFKSFEILLIQRVPGYGKGSTPAKWNLHSNFVVRVAMFRGYFIEFFTNLIRYNRCARNDIFAKALAFRSFLQDFRNVFLLRLFHEIFASNFDEAFNFPLESHAFSSKRISLLKKRIISMKSKSNKRHLICDAAQDFKFVLQSKSEVKNCEELLTGVITRLEQEIKIRCKHFSTYRLNFCNLFDALLDCPRDNLYTFSDHFNDLLQQMVNEHGQFFNNEEIRVEMSAIRSNPDLLSKNVYELLEHFAEYNLVDLFPQSHRLLEFILTLPYLPASRPAGVSKLDDIKRFSYFPEGIGIPSGEVSFLSIECELLQSLRQSSSFHDSVIRTFSEEIKTIPLMPI